MKNLIPLCLSVTIATEQAIATSATATASANAVASVTTAAVMRRTSAVRVKGPASANTATAKGACPLGRKTRRSQREDNPNVIAEILSFLSGKALNGARKKKNL